MDILSASHIGNVNEWPNMADRILETYYRLRDI